MVKTEKVLTLSALAEVLENKGDTTLFEVNSEEKVPEGTIQVVYVLENGEARYMGSSDNVITAFEDNDHTRMISSCSVEHMINTTRSIARVFGQDVKAAEQFDMADKLEILDGFVNAFMDTMKEVAIDVVGSIDSKRPEEVIKVISMLARKNHN